MTIGAKAEQPTRPQPSLNVTRGWFGLRVRESAQRIIDRAGLGDEAHGLVSRVVRRTRLRRGEKREVARELCAHFRDGAEAGASAVDLVRAFGDERSAARLIRRAKRRNRGILWKSWVMVRDAAAVTLGVFVCAYVIFATRLALSERKVSHDYLAEFNAPALAVPLEERGWPILRAAYLGLVKQPFFVEEDGRTTDIFERTPGDKWWPQTTAYLDRIEPALAEFRRASRAKRLAYVAGFEADPELVEHDGGDPAEDQQPARDGDMIDDAIIGVLLVQLGVARRATMLLKIDAQRNAQTGNGERVTENIVAIRGLAEGVLESPTWIGGLIGISMSAMADQLLGEVLVQWPASLSDSQLEELAHNSAATPALAFMRGAVAGERAAFMDTLQRLYTDNGAGDGLIDIGAFERFLSMTYGKDSPLTHADRIPGLGPLAAMVMPSRKAMREKAERIYELMEARRNQRLWQWTKNSADAEIDEMSSHPLGFLNYGLIPLMLPAIDHAMQSQERGAQVQDAMQAAIALELYRRRTGAWPERLEQMIPQFIPSVPVDRFTGGPIGYALRDGKPVLYSVGVDRDDDGGRAPTKTDADGDQSIVYRWKPLAELERLRRENPESIPDGDWVLWPVSEGP